ncbi:MAG: DUF2007 domain-containing protein [Gemmatimonadota bacterium]|nr:DUF2007 domain-containing protein [Gemmatimonadota bacterium]
MDERVHWERIAGFSAAYQADLARQQLEAAEIPVVVRDDQTGIFGPGFSGANALGMDVLVPSDLVEEALEVLADLLAASGESSPA